MNPIRHAIEMALSVGYTLPEHVYINEHGVYTSDERALIYIDPEFWQALTRALGKETKIEVFRCSAHPANYWYFGGFCKECGSPLSEGTKSSTNWKTYMHSFVDHLIEEKDAEDFFKELLK